MSGFPEFAGNPVTVLTRRECSLCEKAVGEVSRICEPLGVRWVPVDVDTDPELRAEFGDRVPVILIDGAEHGFWRVEEKRFRAALARR
ncbi:glutaredoxin family protein [Pseudonocardia eucalypti]|uniref:Glutaredoxin family protein n=1 Tax=Pseudonocardia eucalypti TaxID=648755 RepID=A0ABP9Q0T6_9PSEU|nr:glutaredoxin [Pseudonocardia eucalypti]